MKKLCSRCRTVRDHRQLFPMPRHVVYPEHGCERELSITQTACKPMKVCVGGAVLLKSALFLAVLLWPALCSSQTKVPVYVIDTVDRDDDGTARQYVFEVREAIRASHGFRLLEDSAQLPHIKYAVTVVRTGTGVAAGYTVVYDSALMPLFGGYITSGIRTCRRENVQNCARGALAHIDNAARELQKSAPKLWETLK
jgi:hypothetical protein